MNAADFARARRSGATLDVAEPIALERGYAIAVELAPLLGEVVGWKVGATSAGAQAFLRIDEPIYGRVFAGGVRRLGEPVRLAGERAAEAEPEVIFRLKNDPDPADPLAAIGAAFIGLEVNRPSRDDAFAQGAGFIVADNAAHAGLVIGPELPLAALEAPERIGVRLIRNGEPASEGTAAAVLGDPRRALGWLVAKRAGSERPARAGDWVATGAMCRSVPLAIGDRVEADFGEWGRVVVTREVMPGPDE